MTTNDPLETRFKVIEETLAQIRHELKDINFRLDHLIENFRDHFGP